MCGISLVFLRIILYLCTMKICTKCKIEKEISEFHQYKASNDNLYKWCKSCKKDYDVKYRQSDKIQDYYSSDEYKKKKREEAVERHRRDPRLVMLNMAKHRALKHNFPFNIVLDDIIVPEFCPLLEIPLFVKPYKQKGSFCANSPSLDKIIPELGYVKGNIMVISMKANAMKYNASIEELKLFSKNIQKIY